MITDRLGALKAALNDEDEANEITMITLDERDNFMVEFFNEVEEISQCIDKMNATAEEVKKKHSSILSAPSTNQKVKDELEDLMEEIKRLSNKVRKKLKTMGQNIEQQEHVNPSSADLRIQNIQHVALSRRFVDSLSQYNTIQTDYRQRCKDRIKRQLEITGKYKTDEEIEDMLESGNPAVFTQEIVIETQKTKQTLADIEDRHADIISLEKSIRELHEMFLDMAVLIEAQGELVDRIEYNVENAKQWVGDGKKKINMAEKFQAKARKKQILLIIVGIIVLVILGLVIGYTV